MRLQRLSTTATPEPQAEPESRSAPRPPRALSPQAVIALQQTAGNAAVGRALARVPAPAAEAPATGTDWVHVWDALLLTEGGRPTLQTVRTFGEWLRVMPVAGGLTGLAADAIATGQDLFGPTWQYEAPITRVLMGARGALNAFNNGLGHLTYVSQLTQDLVALGTGFTAGPLTMGVNEGLALSKLLVDTVQAGLDTTLTTMAIWNATHSGPPAPGEPDPFDAWMQVAINYEANLVGDVISMVFDGIDSLTAGLGHGNTLEDIGDFLADIEGFGRRILDLIVTELQGQLNLRGGDALQGIVDQVVPVARAALPGAESLALDAAIFTLQQMQGAHQTGDELMGEAAGAVGELAARANEIATELLDGQEPFAFVREQAAGAVGELYTRIATLGELAEGGRNSAATCAAVLGYVEQTRAALTALEVPQELGLAGPELGEGMLADAGEALLGAGAGLANQAASAALARLQDALDVAKRTLFAGLDALAAQADEIGRFMALMAEQASRQAAELEGLLARLEEALARTENFEELFETLIEQSLAAAGIAVDVDLDALRAAWTDAGRWIDQLLADFQSRRDGGPALPVDEAGIRGGPHLAGAPPS